MSGTEMFDFSFFYDRIAQMLPNDCRICEVGAANGDSAIYLAKQLYNLDKKFKLYMVDDMSYGKYNQMKTIYENIIKSRLGRSIEVMPYDSVKASAMFNGNSLDFLFIDSSHTYKDTILEIPAWYPKLKDGCIMAGHDYFSHENPGVREAVDELLPNTIHRASIFEEDYEQHFEPEQLLHTEATANGYGIWRITKNFYWQPKESTYVTT